jgi:tetratricopeptide (TPR) repeat protein/transglutaminase-like putative cysteine protease
MRWRISTGAIWYALASGLAGPLLAQGKTDMNPRIEVPVASKYEIAPPPAWVLPATIPPAPADARGAATIDLLIDSQVRFAPEGDVTYSNAVYSIENAQGLDDGAIQIGWDPALERLVVHHIRLIRDGKATDLLGDGSKLTVVRREKNLEKAAIDGRLTLLMQPDDLRVGDIIDYSFTRTRRDPAMGGHSEFFIGPRDGASFGRSRIRMLWLTSRSVKWRALPGVVQPTFRKVGGETELLSDVSNATTKDPPQGAPSRFRAVNSVQVSDFADWAAVSSNLEPLYAKAATIAPDSPLKAEVARIAAASKDPKVRAEMALALVQEKVRYLLIEMNGGGYRPTNADVTWSRRYGDCKAKTVLLIALLRELGVSARPVLVSTTMGDSVAVTLPSMGAFDHVIAEASIAGKSYWLDGTRLGDRSLAQIKVPNFGYGLPIIAAGARPIALVPDLPSEPTEVADVAIDASAGLDAPAPVTAEYRFRGDAAITKRLDYSTLSARDQGEALRKLWRKNYDFITPDSVTVKDDPATGDYVLAMTGKAKMDWTGEAGTRWYEVDGARVGWRFDIVRDNQLNPDAPFAIDYPDYWAKRETIKLPYGAKDFRLQGGNVDEQVGGIYAFHRSVKIDGGVMTMEATTRALANELPAAKAAATRARMAELGGVGVFVRAPDDYRATDADIIALKDDRPALAKALLARGAHRFDAGEGAASLADIDAALAIDDKVGTAHAIRAMLLAAKGDVRADAAADAALAIDPKSWMALYAKGMLAFQTKRLDEAETYFSKSIELEPKFFRSLGGRGAGRLMQGNYAGALVDFDAALAIEPASPPLLAGRVGALMALGRIDAGMVATEQALVKNPMNFDLRHVRALGRSATGKSAEALKDYDALIAEKPSVGLLLERAALNNGAARTSDIEAAVRLDPRSVRALMTRADVAIEAGATDAGANQRAEADLAAVDKIDPGNRSAVTVRMRLLAKEGKPAEAIKLGQAMVVKYHDATAYNELCWSKATLNVAIDTALADCDKGLSLAPDALAILDSRAFVKLRTGAIDEAIADYDAVLKKAPTMAASLFGRAVARAKKGNVAGAKADLAEARRISPEIEARFAGYGVTVPAGVGR